MGEIIDEIKELLKAKKFNSIEEMNKFVQEHADQKNSTPLEDFGGLSPAQMSKLLYIPFDSNDSPVVFNCNLSEDELKNALFYCQARKFLNLIKDNSPIPATISGNLNRNFVSSAVSISSYDTEYLKKYCKVVNELDFFWLHITRLIFKFADLIRLSNKKFTITRKGKDMLNAAPGEFYYTLFRTFLLKFNLAYLSRGDFEIPEMQQFFNFPLYIARTHCKDWMTVREFLESVLVKGLRLNNKYKEYLEQPYHSDNLIWAGLSRIVRPLIDFGLLEIQESTEKNKKSFDDKIRRTPLLEKFINFDFTRGTN